MRTCSEQLRQAAGEADGADAMADDDDDPGAALGDGRDARARPQRRRLRRGRRLLRRRVPLHRGPAGEVRQARACSTRRSPRAASSASAIGMGAYGLRPVVEIQFADYIYPASDQIVSEAARLRYRSAGDFTAPITVRMPCGGGIYGGQTHSQSPEALFTHVCGIRTVIPSQPVRRQGPADRGDRERRPGHLPRAQAALQRPVRRPSRPAGRAVVEASAGRGARGLLHGAARQGGGRCAPAPTLTVLTYGTMVLSREAAAERDRRRRRDHRPAHASGRSTSRRSSPR